MDVGETIRRIRKAKNITQVQLGELTGRNQATISLIERGGTSSPHPDSLKNICEVLGISEALLMLESINESDIPQDKENREVWEKSFPSVKRLFIELLSK